MTIVAERASSAKYLRRIGRQPEPAAEIHGGVFTGPTGEIDAELVVDTWRTAFLAYVDERDAEGLGIEDERPPSAVMRKKCEI